VDPLLQLAAAKAIGFMPEEEGLALYAAALEAALVGPLLEIGSYCGKSAIYLGAAARVQGTVLFSIDHHRGSEEHQPGEEYHDPLLIDEGGRVDTLPAFRRTISGAGLDTVVLGIVARSEELARVWRKRLGLVFIDGGHSLATAVGDYEGWAPHVLPGGALAIHDVFPDPAHGGRPPYEVYLRALRSGDFEEIGANGSLRILRKL
jgi:predicted O-methyltransferase YrrM